MVNDATPAAYVDNVKQAQTKELLAVKHELNRLLEVFGVEDLSPSEWMLKIHSEIQRAWVTHATDSLFVGLPDHREDEVERTLIGVAAVAVAAVESIRRQRGNGWL